MKVPGRSSIGVPVGTGVVDFSMAVYLIDGTAFLYRAFYAIRNLTAPDGRPTNAVYGFTNMLLKLIREQGPEGLAVSFDKGGKTERHELYEAYKANRKETPEELRSQFPLARTMIEALDIPVFEKEGVEADDILATLALKEKKKGHEVFIVSSDKDMMQVVDSKVRIYDPMKDTVVGPEEVKERIGVGPERVTEYMALVGDASDNIPGVKGVGEKTAKYLLGKFGSLDELIENAEKIEKPRLRKLISEGTDSIRLSKRLAELSRDVALEDKDMALKGPDTERLRELLTELGFTSMLRMLGAKAAPASKVALECVLDLKALKKEIKGVKKAVALDTEATGLDPMSARLVGFSLSWGAGRAVYVPVGHCYLGAPEQIGKKEALGALAPLLGDERVSKAGHNLKYDILLLKHEGIEVKGPLMDTMLASHLLNPERQAHSLEAVALEHLGRTKKPYKEVAGSGGFEEVDLEKATDYAADDALLAWQLKEKLFPALRKQGLWELYETLEMPLLEVLADMEAAGVKVDVKKLEKLGAGLETEMAAVKQRAWFLAGEEFNLNSPKQLGQVLFEKLGLTPGKKKKTGYSTDVSVLEDLAREHELPGEVLAWRSLSKLKNTYVDVLPRLVNPETGRVHTSFNQAATATGRLSSSAPNLQNIPVRGDWGTRIRSCFIAERGSKILSADYSQIELRVLAHLSGDEALKEAFMEGVDIHSRTAEALFGVTGKKVTPEMRRTAKTVNFGVLYGMSAFGLSESLGILRSEAEAYIEGYFEAHPGVSAYIKRTVEEAGESGFVSTLMGRRRPVPELNNSNRNIRLLGERLAVNTPVQGSAADIIKAAMIRIARRLRELKMGTRMILQVHDELLLEVPSGEQEEAVRLVARGMQEAVELAVPLEVEHGIGKNWAEAH
jgi:DNA polymerase-1